MSQFVEPILIRPPTREERRACRMLLPRATAAGQKAQLHVAVAGPGARVVGAAALGPDNGLLEAGAPGGARWRWQVDLRVIAPFRRRGIGRALMQRVVEQAAGHGIPALYAWEWVEPESEAARAWAALGFSPSQRRLEFEADAARSHAALLPLYQQARSGGWIPPEARMISLAEADHDEIVRLHVQYLGGTRRLLMPLLRGTAEDAYDPVSSRVLLLGGQIVGFTLGRLRPAEGVCEFDANVVDPLVRSGWPILWLRVDAVEHILARGIHTIRYTGLQQHTDTHRAGRRVGAKLVRTLVQMRRDLTGDITPLAAEPPPAGDGGSGGAG